MEPLNFSRQTEAPKAEKAESDDEDDSNSSSRRAKAVSRFHIVRNEEAGQDDRENRDGRGDKAEQAVEPPKNVIELFKSKVEPAESRPEQGTEAAAEAQDEKDLEAVPSVMAAEHLQELPDDEPAEVVELLDRVAGGEPIAETAQDIQERLGATEEELAALEEQMPSILPAETEPEPVGADAETGSEAEPEEAEPEAVPAASEEEVVFDRSAEASPDDQEDDDPLVAHGAAAGTAATAATGAGGGAGGTATPPPPGGATVPPGGPPFGRPGGPGGPGFPGGSGPNPNILHATPVQSGNLNTPPSTEVYDSGNPAVTALIGYLIGRRHGRRKAERRAAKDQRKYERQVKKRVEDIDWQLRAKEQHIRKLAEEKAKLERNMYIIPKPGRESPRPHPLQRTAEVIPHKRNIERKAAPEANDLHDKHRTHEHLGKVLFGTAAELPLAAAAGHTASAESIPGGSLPKPRPPEVLAPTTPAAELPKHLTERQVETLNRNELLAMSEKIVVDGSSLRQIYETHLVGERGLRRLVAEHLRGGDVKKILRHEIVEHEIDFERDPAVRDVPVPSSGAPAGNSLTAPPPAAKATLDRLVQQASSGLGDVNPQAAYYKARAAYEAQEQQAENSRRRVIDISLITIIAALSAAIIIILITRR